LAVLLRLAYLGLTNTFALLRLIPKTDRDKDTEILVLRHQITVLQRQLSDTRVRFSPTDRALLAALLHRLPHQTLHRLRQLVRPDTILRWQRDLLRRRHARVSRPNRPGRPRTIRSVRVLVLRLAKENPSWGYRRVHGELLVLGVKVAASTVWQILTDAGIDPAPDRASSTWAQFLHSQAEVLLGCDSFETVTLTGVRMYVLVAIEHAQRRIRILGATPHPTAAWVTQAARNLAMDLEDASSRTRFLIRDRDGKFPHRHPGRAERCSDAQDELDRRTLDPNLPPRTTRPHPHLEPTTPTPRTPRIRALLQQPPTTPRHRANTRPLQPLSQLITNRTGSVNSTSADAHA
jgi:putative transposase